MGEAGGENMEMDSIQKVAGAEQESQERREAAAAESRRTVAEARKAAEELLEEARRQAGAETRQMLAQALKELMKTSPLEKISVNDIVEHAGVGRNTFYYHFEDKFDLVNWYFQSGATQFLVTRGHYASWSTLLTDLEEYLLQNKTFYVNALAYTGQNCLQEYVFHYLSEMFGQRLLSLVPSATERDCQFTGNYLSGAMLGLLQPWVRNGMPPLNQADLDHGLRTLCSCNLAVLLGYGIDPSALVL